MTQTILRKQLINAKKNARIEEGAVLQRVPKVCFCLLTKLPALDLAKVPVNCWLIHKAIVYVFHSVKKTNF